MRVRSVLLSAVAAASFAACPGAQSSDEPPPDGKDAGERDAQAVSRSGTLDETFGDRGKTLSVTLTAPTNLVVRSDDRLLIGTSSAVVARYLPNGVLDPMFGTNGVSNLPETSPYTFTRASNLIELPDGRIMVAAQAAQSSGASQVALIRYLSDGSVDLSLGAGRGFVVLSLDGGMAPRPIALASWSGPDGLRLVVGGMPSAAEGADGPLLVRTDLDGKLDPTLADGKGWVVPVVGQWTTRAMAIQPDGKVLVAGFRFSSVNNDFAMVRTETDGTLDGAFGEAGLVTTSFFEGNGDYGLAIALLPDLRFVVGGFTMCTSLACGADLAVARYYGDGTLDPSFGRQGKVVVVNTTAQAIALLPDGGLFTGGSGRDNVIIDLGGGWGRGSPEQPSVAKLDASGQLNVAFGTPSPPDYAGVVRTSFGDAYTRSYVMSLGIQSSGKLVVLGSISSYADGAAAVGLVRFHP